MDSYEVARAWLRGERARSKSLLTKNGKIWSYSTLIGKTTADGDYVIYDYTNSAGNFVSPATTRHVTAIIDVAWKEAESGKHVIISPKVPTRYKGNKNDQRRSAGRMA